MQIYFICIYIATSFTLLWTHSVSTETRVAQIYSVHILYKTHRVRRLAR